LHEVQKMKRRNFIKTILAAATAPAFIKADNLMKIYLPPQKIYIHSGRETGENLLSLVNSRNAMMIFDDKISVNFIENLVKINSDCTAYDLIEFGKKYCPKMIKLKGNKLYIDGHLEINAILDTSFTQS